MSFSTMYCLQSLNIWSYLIKVGHFIDNILLVHFKEVNTEVFWQISQNIDCLGHSFFPKTIYAIIALAEKNAPLDFYLVIIILIMKLNITG